MARKRHYDDYDDLRRAALEIVEDVMFYGESGNWDGVVDDHLEVERVLRPFGVIYSHGRWVLDSRAGAPEPSLRSRLTEI